MSADLAATLCKHQGPYFNGIDSRCLCGELVETGPAWADHVAHELQSAEEHQ